MVAPVSLSPQRCRSMYRYWFRAFQTSNVYSQAMPIVIYCFHSAVSCPGWQHIRGGCHIPCLTILLFSTWQEAGLIRDCVAFKKSGLPLTCRDLPVAICYEMLSWPIVKAITFNSESTELAALYAVGKIAAIWTVAAVLKISEIPSLLYSMMWVSRIGWECSPRAAQ